MTFELRHLRYVLAVVEFGSFRRAAKSLSVEPSTVSRRVRDLEDNVGAALFIRGQGGVKLTIAGERFVHKARKGLKHLNQAAMDVSDLGRGHEGSIKIGLMSSMASGFIADLLDAFCRNHGAVRIEYVEGETSDLVPAIKQHGLDIAFLTGEEPLEGCDVLHLWNERVFVAMSENHELARQHEIRWNDLRSRDFVLSEAQSGAEIRDYLVKNLAELGYRPSIQPHAVYRDTLMHIVAGGQSLTLTTEATIATQFPGITYRPLAGEILPFRAVWSSRNDNPAFRRLLSLAKCIAKRRCIP